MFGRININPRARTDETGWQTLLLPVRDLRPTADASGPARRVVLTGDKDATFSLEQFALTVDSPRLVASIRRASDPPGTQISEITVEPGRDTTLVADVEAGTSDVEVTWNFDADNSGSYPAPATMGGPGGFPGGPPGGFPGGMPPGMMPPGMMPPGAGGFPAAGGPPGGFPGGMPPGMMPPGADMMGGQAAFAGPRIDARGLSARPDWPNEEQNYRVEITVRDRAGRKDEVKASLLVKVRG
jgi:hypothetical protein